MKGIIVVDSFSTYSLHQMYNGCLAVIVDKIFDNVLYVVGDEQRRALKEVIYDSNYKLSSSFKFQKIYVPKGEGKTPLLMRYFAGTLQNLRFMMLTPKHVLLLFNINNPFALIPMKILNIFTQRDILIVAHGELEYIRKVELSEPSPLFYKFLGVMLKVGLKLMKSSKKIRFVVLGDIIKRNLLKYNLVPESSILVVDHPYFFKIGNFFNKEADTKIHLGTIGALSRPKGSTIFFDLAQHYRNNPRVVFHVVGSLFDDSINTNDYPNVIFHAKGREFLLRDKFISIAEMLDYVLFLYPVSMYRLMASGAIFDAVDLNKPVICFGNDYFKYLFEKHGSFGIMSANITEMIQRINEIIEDKVDFNFRENVAKVKRFHSVEGIADQFVGQLQPELKLNKV